MAVVQISRIQVRRGRKNQGTGLPQLASGEIAWAIDTQELYIGNGAVSEGAPEVSNTKILTEHDNLLDLAGQYEYRSDNTDIVTGPSPAYPVIRSLQARLDETVSVYSFGAIGDGVVDDTTALQNAINQLFMTTTAREDQTVNVELYVPPGVYKISETLLVPSNTKLVGAGSGKTTFNYIGNNEVFVFVNDSSRPGNIDPDTLSVDNQPSNITISGISLITQTENQSVITFDGVKDSLFCDLDVEGAWGETIDISGSAVGGLHFNTLGLATCTNNIFRRVTVSGFTFAVFAKGDISYNTFEHCVFKDAYQGFRLGRGIDGFNEGQLTGPINTIIKNCHFELIKRHGVYLNNGIGNTVSGNTFVNVGNNGGGNSEAAYEHVYFGVAENHVADSYSDRPRDLASDNEDVKYVGEVGGIVSNKSFGVQQIAIGTITEPILAFRLPVSPDVTGYQINYTYKSTTKEQSRSGVMSIAVDAANELVQLTDSYDFNGPEEEDDTLEFSAELLSIDSSQINTLAINYVNPTDGDTAVITYSYSVIQTVV